MVSKFEGRNADHELSYHILTENIKIMHQGIHTFQKHGIDFFNRQIQFAPFLISAVPLAGITFFHEVLPTYIPRSLDIPRLTLSLNLSGTDSSSSGLRYTARANG